MSSLGGQWRVIRHYLSLANLNSEIEKLLQRLRAAPPSAAATAATEQWQNLIQKLEKGVLTRLQELKELEGDKSTLKATTVEEAKHETKPEEKKEDKLPAKAAPAGLSVGSEARDITVEGLLQGLKLKKDLSLGKISEPGWKSSKPVVNKTSIHSRTAYVVSALVAASGAACVAKRAEDFILHLHQYPEARDYAIKEGAVRALLRVQARLAREVAAAEPRALELDGIVNEALALVGWAGPPRGPGPCILSLDGGGVRGLIAIEVLRHVERLAARPVSALFDYIIGVSTGAIIAAVIGSGVGNLETASKMYHTLSKEMFGNTSLIGGTSRLVWTHSYYDTALWEKMLRDNLGDLTLSQCNRTRNPKMALVSCVSQPGARLAPFLFRTYGAGFRRRGAVGGAAAARVWHAVRASAAAPTYFDEFKLDGLVHQDGGIMVNNPTGVGLHEAKLLYGADAMRRAVVVSVGTGQAPAAARAPDEARPTSWRDKFNRILDSATDTEGVHLLLNDLLPHGSYYRFNPPLMEQCAMDEIDPAKLQHMITDTHAYIRRNQHKFERAAAMLIRKRSLAQRVGDELHRRAILLGVAHPH